MLLVNYPQNKVEIIEFILQEDKENIFQHWKNPGFIQDREKHVQDADLGSLKTLVTCSWSICSKISKSLAKIHSIGKILVSFKIGKNVQDVDLDCYHGSKYALRCFLFIGSKKTRFEGEEKLVEKRRKIVEKSRKLVEKSRKLVEKRRKLVEKSRAS